MIWLRQHLSEKAQRARQAEAGNRKLELQLDTQEIEMLERNCASRRPGRAPYDMTEYIALLIRQMMHGCATALSVYAPANAPNAATRFRLKAASCLAILSAG